MKTIRMESNVEEILKNPFCLSDLLEEFVVDSTSEFFTSVDGVLFTKDLKLLVSYPGAKKSTDYTLPYGVETLTIWSMPKAMNLQTLFLPPMK